jgi:hypothetical protein
VRDAARAIPLSLSGMSFLSRLFGKNTKDSDPTRDWPPATNSNPQMNVERRALESFGGRLTLGDRIEAARILGRPDAFEASGAWTILRYERWGLVLEFEEQQLFSVEFQIRELASGPSGRLEAVEPRGPDDVRLTAKTTKAELLERFGPAEGDHEYADAGQLLYTRAPMVLSYVLNEDERLVAWKISANI